VTTGPETKTDTIVEERTDYRLDEGEPRALLALCPQGQADAGDGRGHPGTRTVRQALGPVAGPAAVPGVPECKRIYDEGYDPE
jgi:hypothetical protein